MDDVSLSTPPILSRDDLIEIMQVVMRIGMIMLRSGTVSFRVEQAMCRVAIALGVERLDVYVTLTGITATAHAGKQHYTEIKRIKGLGIDMNRVSLVEALSQSVTPGTKIATVSALLDRIEAMPPLYPRSVTIGMIAIACGAFAMVEGGQWPEFTAAAVGAGLGQSLRFWLQSIRLNPVAATALSAAIAAILCHVTFVGMAAVGIVALAPKTGFLASVLFLVPGVMMVTAVLDLLRSDLVSGLSRLAFALLLISSIAAGVLFTLETTQFPLL